VEMRSSAGRVRLAILLYLAVFCATNVQVWGVYAHGVLVHSLQNEFPLGSKIERFGDLVRFTAKPQVGKDPRMTDGEHMLGMLFPKNYPPFAVLIYKFLLQTCAPYAVPVMMLVELGALVAACLALWRRATAGIWGWRSSPAVCWAGGPSRP